MSHECNNELCKPSARMEDVHVKYAENTEIWLYLFGLWEE